MALALLVRILTSVRISFSPRSVTQSPVKKQTDQLYVPLLILERQWWLQAPEQLPDDQPLDQSVPKIRQWLHDSGHAHRQSVRAAWPNPGVFCWVIKSEDSITQCVTQAPIYTLLGRLFFSHCSA